MYTKKGDQGESTLSNGKKLPKNSQYFDALGSLDELNSHVGFAKELCIDAKIDSAYITQLSTIQSSLLNAGSFIAGIKAEEAPVKLRFAFSEKNLDLLEKWIDELGDKLPPLESFVLPGGSKASAYLHVCRSVCRRAERSLVELLKTGELKALFAYMNRLSTYFFTLARAVCIAEGKQEVKWSKENFIK